MNIAKKFKAVLFAFSILVLISVGVLFISNMSNAYAVDEAATNDQFGYIESGQDDNADANGQFGKHAKLKVFIENPANSNCTISVNKGGKIGYLSEGKYESIEIEFNYHCSFYINNEHTLVLMSSKNEITSANDDSFNIPVSESMYCEFKIMPNEGYIIDGDGWNLKKDNIPIDIASNLLDGRFLNDEEGFNKYSGGIFTPVVKPAAGFNGKVIDGSDPVAGANVQFTTSSGNTYSSVTDDNGMYRFDLPVYEGGTISVFKEGYKCSNLIVTAGEVESGDIDDINITAINNPVNIKGTVKGCKESAQAEKFNLPNAKLYFLIDNSPVYMSQADEDGNYSIQVENGDNGTLWADVSGFNRGYVAFDDPITEDQNDIEVLLYQDEGNSVALYFNVDSEHAKVAKNTENPRVATGGMYKKETCSYHFDWDTGDILVTADNGNDVYRVKADDGYAFYDWHIYNSNNEPVDLELNMDVTENLFFYGHIWPAAKLNLSVGAEESHECFKITSSTNEDYNPGYSIESEEFNCDLYEGTKVTFEGDRVKTYCEINEENADPYIEEYDLQAIPKENYSFAQWTLNGEVVEDGTTLTVEQFKNLNIGVNYKSTITPTPDNPDIITTNTAQTGDNVGIFAIVGLLASVIVSYSISRKAWKKN